MDKEVVNFIKKYTNDDYCNIKKLIEYLELHSMVGIEVFEYVNGKVVKGNYMAYYDGYEPIEVDKFIRRIPFYYYTGNFCKDKSNKYKTDGNLLKLLDGNIICNATENMEIKRYFKDITLEKFYQELEYLFYEQKLELVDIFNYMIDQTGKEIQEYFLNWVNYLHIIENKKDREKMPECFITAYNEVLEEEGRECIRYTLSEHPFGGYYSRQGKYMQFFGVFPLDKNGNPIMKWAGLKIVNGGEIRNGSCEKSTCGFIYVEVKPDMIVEFWDVITDENLGWLRLYTGPMNMEFDYTVLKRYRNRLHMTQREVAEAVGANVRTYQKWESGETQPDSYYLLRLMNWLNIEKLEYVVKTI